MREDHIIIARKIFYKSGKLRQVSKETTLKEVEELDLINRLREANKHAWTEGCGLAAIQIGIPLRFAWFKAGKKEGVLLNPVITNSWGKDVQKEGCLSIPNKYVYVPRAVTIEYTSNGKKKGKVSGFLARLIQHEIDHMDGILNIDRVEK